MARYPTKHATSAGGLVYDDRADGRWVVLIAHRNAGGVLQWTLPKGGLEEGEDLEEAAVREVREETGLEARIEAKLGVVDYWFVWRPDRVRYHKYVHYYLMGLQGGDFSRRDDEAEDVAWLPIDEALDRLAHPNEARLVRRALDSASTDDATDPDPDPGADQVRTPRETGP
ncbi:NUDIX hydrolase [Euzebya sp.]|uniref:NUDIX hydrolase n=1 Tax=Euzebya sp. TaxID=1971409 RepID=UPI003514098B